MLLYTIVLFVLLKGVSGPNESKNKTSVSLFYPKCRMKPEILLNLPYSGKALEIYCQHFLKYYRCVDKYRMEFAEDRVAHIALMLAKAETFMRKKLCKKTPIRQRYIVYAVCFEIISQEVPFCFELAKNLIAKHKALDTKPNKLMAVSSHCLYTSASLVCLGRSISQTCGPDARKLYIEIVEGTKFYSQMCPEFQFKYALRRAKRLSLETRLDVCNVAVDSRCPKK